MAKLHYGLLGLALLVTFTGCWSSRSEPPVPEQKTVESQAEPPPAPAEREIVSGEYRIKLDLANQVLRLDLKQPESWRQAGSIQPDDSVTVVPREADVFLEDHVIAVVRQGRVLPVSEVRGDFVGVSLLAGGKPVAGWMRRQDVAFKGSEPKLEPRLADLPHGQMLAAAILLQKAKLFDDGLYAAVELAAENRAGKLGSKREMLARLVGDVLEQAGDTAPTVLLAAARLAGVEKKLPAAMEPKVADAIAEFARDPARSLPISFYNWSPGLERIFKQDRMLQTPLKPDDAQTLAAALERDSKSRATYEACLELSSKLTNPPDRPDLLLLLKSGANRTNVPRDISFFPPSRSFEGDLTRRIAGPRGLPDNVNIMDELVKQIRAGKMSLAPSASSGWYDYTAWSLEPLVTPDKADEASRLELTSSYGEHLTELFKGALALARETHTKALPPIAATAMPPRRQRPEFTIRPELAAEPLATSYVRRALAYRFVAKALNDVLGPDELEKLHRLKQTGPLAANLSDELNSMESFFVGAAAVVGRQLGMPKILPEELRDRAQAAEKTITAWAASLEKDEDLAADIRMMVPVYVAPDGRIKVWAVLGWTSQQCEISFARHPIATVVDAAGKPLDPANYDLHWASSWDSLATPVMAEVYVGKLLSREEFRKHCDAYFTPAAILANLE